MSINNILKKLNESKRHIPDEINDVSSEIHQKVDKEVLDYMKSEGFPEKEAREYSRVDAYFDHLDGGRLIIEVGAEVSYDGLMELCDRLNPIVVSYDEESYFEPVTSGIIAAWLDFNTLVEGIQYSEPEDNKPEYVCKSIKVDNKGIMEIVCYDAVEDEEFTKYIGQVEDPSARKSARLILRDWKFEVPREIRNELISTFGLEEFGYSIEEGVYSPFDQSDRDNSEYNKSLKKEEESHPYVGKKVRWSEDSRSYRVTGAYEDNIGVTVRCGDITMKPGEYTLLGK